MVLKNKENLQRETSSAQVEQKNLPVKRDLFLTTQKPDQDVVPL